MLTRVGARDMRQDAPVKPVDVMPLAMIFLEKATVLTRNSTRSPSSKAAIAASAHAPAGARASRRRTQRQRAWASLSERGGDDGRGEGEDVSCW